MRRWYGLFLVAGLFLVSGCVGSTTFYKKSDNAFSASGAMAEDMAAVQDDVPAEVERKLIWNADLSVDVKSVSNAVEQATAMVKAFDGYIENKSFRKEESARLRLRVPATALNGAMGRLESLGDVTHRYVSSRDVTEEYIDVESRLNNKKILRDRLKQLLDQATAVKDVLAIEKELNRVQSDIDSMEQRIRSLKGKVDYATIDLDLSRKKIYGPLGLVFKWTGDFFGKLFVIQ